VIKERKKKKTFPKSTVHPRGQDKSGKVKKQSNPLERQQPKRKRKEERILKTVLFKEGGEKVELWGTIGRKAR